MAGTPIHTERLRLRPWRADDQTPFAAMNADPQVMEYFAKPLDRAESDALIASFIAEYDEVGFCPFALELAATGQFLGFVGLHRVPALLPFAPAVEVGWRLAHPFWGYGFATEAAAAALRFGFDEIGLTEIVSFTAAINLRSRRVMERLGMHHDRSADFAHPGIAPDDPLAPHVLYRVASIAFVHRG